MCTFGAYDAINKAAKLVINHCLKNQIGTVVFGWNQSQKDSLNLGSKVNQEFVSIPTARLKNRITELCHLYGINYIETEESYTSKASSLDGDKLPVFGEKPEDWRPSGERIERGLYRTAKGYLINADANGAFNILRKVSTTLAIELEEVSMVSLTTPQRLKLWSAKKVKQCSLSPLHNSF